MLLFIKNGFEQNKRKNKVNILFYFLLILSTSVFSQTSLKWNFYQADKTSDVYSLGEKGYVQNTFRDLGVLPDPFYGLNEEKYGWIEDKDWIFESSFMISKDDLAKDFIDLNLPSIDTYSTIFINGEEVGKTESSFIYYRFEIKKYLKEGENSIRLHFVSPINFHKEEYRSLKVKYPTPNDANDTIQVVSMSRKPQYQFGWDWALRINTIGLNEAAFIRAYNENIVLQTSIQTVSIQDDSAIMALNVIFRNPVVASDVKMSMKGIEKESIEDIRNLDEKTVQFSFKVKNPRLYWPIGYGEQYLYHSPLRIFLKEESIYQDEQFYFGISQKQLIQQEDQWGTSFEIHWNNQLVFCKGGDYIPQDIFLSEITEERMKSIIDQCAEANFNMIRIWGGGYYLPDYFYRYCAEKGIMIWQDFMFACSIYPGDAHFLNLVQQEAEYQVPRIATHPNIAYFNGNNEVMVAGKYWGFKLKYLYGNKTEKQFEENYDKLFKQLLSDEVKKWTTLPYEHTSPLSHWGKDEWYRHGTQHYWGVWHGSDPLEDMAKKSGRFNAEYGFQSFPEYSTWLKVSERKDWDLKSDVIKQHQKSYVGNGMILKQTKKLFGEPKDFEDFVYLSQLTQAEAVGLAVASQRLQYPRVTGTLYWQINDCWPVSSWSSIDYYDNWKALHYRVRDDFEPIAVLRNWEDSSFHYYLWSDLTSPKEVEMKMTLYSFEGKKLQGKNRKTTIQPFEKIQLDDWLKGKEQCGLMMYEWEYEGKSFKRSFILNERSFQRSNQDLIQVKKIEKISEGKMRIHFENQLFAAYVWFTFENGGVHTNQNFEHYLPGSHSIDMDYSGDLPTIEQLKVKNL